MFEIMLMRHAKSDWKTHAADIDRPLNRRGRRDAERMGIYLGDNKLIPDRVVISAAQRTRETADLLLSNLSVPDKSRIIDKELYLAGLETLLNIIEEYAVENKRLLILAHNPGMDELVSYLASEPLSYTMNGKLMTTCALACFQLDSLDALNKPGMGKLTCLLRPKEITAGI